MGHVAAQHRLGDDPLAGFPIPANIGVVPGVLPQNQQMLQPVGLVNQVVPAVQRDEVPIDPLIRRMNFIRNLRDKASSMLLTKDLSSRSDHKVVINAMVSLARKEKAHEFVDDTAKMVTDVFYEALASAFDTRIAGAETVVESRLQRGEIVGRVDCFSCGFQLQNARPLHVRLTADFVCRDRHLSDLETLNFFETRAPFSDIPDVVAHHKGFYLFGLMLRILLGILMESFISNSFYFCAWQVLIGMRQPFVGELEIVRAIALLVVSCSYSLRETLRVRYRHVNYLIIGFTLRVCAHVILLVPTTTLDESLFLLYLFVHFMWNMITFGTKFMLDIFYNRIVIDDICLDDFDIQPSIVQESFTQHTTDPVCKAGNGLNGVFGIKGIVPTIFRQCHHNEEIAICGRVGKQLPMHTSKIEEKRIYMNWKVLFNVVFRVFDNLIPVAEEPMNFYDWACSFPPARRRQLIETRTNTHDMPQLIAKSFIKREIALKDESDLVFKDPRFIQGCPVELSAAVGPSLRVWTKQVRRSLLPSKYVPCQVRRGKQVIYTCGMSNEEIGQALKDSIGLIEELMDHRDELVFIEDDQSRFDLHLVKGPFHFLKHLYRRKLRKRPAALLRRSVSRGTSLLGTTYSIPYTMQSGWPDTSVGDTLVNAAMKHSIHGTGRDWVSIICGDDSVTVTTQSELDRLGGPDQLIKRYADLGMEVKVKVVKDVMDVEFCSGRFFPVNSTYILFPKTAKILAKICWDTKLRSAKDHIAWIRGIAATLEFYGKVDPLLGSLAIPLRNVVGVGRVLYDSNWEYSQYLDGSLHSSFDDIYQYYDYHYHLNSGDVKRLSALISQQKLGTLLDDYTLHTMVLKDLEA